MMGMGGKPLAIDLCCGLGGWTEGLLAEGWRVRGYDIEAHEYGDEKYPAELVIRNVLEMHGSELADADLIVASPPCTEYSYMAMPWGRAKQIARALRGQDEFPEPYRGSRTIEHLNAIFNACFRLQREASEAAGRHIPMLVENVKGAQPWVGRAAWNFGSFYLWGDLPALMPSPAGSGVKVGGMGWYPPDDPRHQVGAAFNPAAQGAAFQAAREARKNTGGSWFNIGSPGQKNVGNNPDGRKAPAPRKGRRTDPGNGVRFTSRDCGIEGRKNGNDWFGAGENCSLQRRAASGSSARKQASAQIAKIPFTLSSHIARVYKPQTIEKAA
jgi:hypothetical protein